MSKDIYAALSGAMGSWTRMEVVSNNLANVSTNGYKAGRVAFRVDGPSDDVAAQVYSQATSVSPDRTDGSLQATGGAFDFALQGEGFFAVQAGNELLLTRDGRFGVDANGYLVDNQGHPVLGEGGPIEVLEEAIRIADDGMVYGEQSGELDRLLLVDGPAEPAGGGLWRPRGNLRAAQDANVVQGALEKSNVDPLGTMVELIDASRWFEAFQKTMQTSDELDERLIQIGR